MSFLGLFPQVQKSVFLRIFYGCRNFDGEIFWKKLMMFVDIHNKYFEQTLLTYENIEKVNRIISLQAHIFWQSVAWNSLINFVHFIWKNLPYSIRPLVFREKEWSIDVSKYIWFVLIWLYTVILISTRLSKLKNSQF